MSGIARKNKVGTFYYRLCEVMRFRTAVQTVYCNRSLSQGDHNELVAIHFILSCAA